MSKEQSFDGEWRVQGVVDAQNETDHLLDAMEQNLRSDGTFVSWKPPAPRAGAKGAWDKFVGPGATGLEENIQLVLGAAIAILGVGLFWFAQGATASIWQWLFVLVLAFDIGGGIVTNSTSAAKRWYHRAGHGKRQHFLFNATHLIHIGLMAFLFAAQPWLYGIALGGMVVVATLIVINVPLYVQRPVAVGLAMIIIMVGQLPLFDIAGLNWFIPALMLKLILGHALKEAPFQPGDQ